jgi:hypothetical protein
MLDCHGSVHEPLRGGADSYLPVIVAQTTALANQRNEIGILRPALGEALAAWIVDGTPSIDLAPLSITRFSAGSWSEDQLKQQAAWQYRHVYGAV